MLSHEQLTASDFYEQQDRFQGLSQSDQILRAAWYIQLVCGKTRFQPKDITKFFIDLSLITPNVHVNIKRLCECKPKKMMADRAGYYLEGNCSRALSDLLLSKVDTVSHLTSKALHGLSELVGDSMQRSFLAETLNCYRAGAFRATVVMAWNLAFDHLTRWVCSDSARLATFNISLTAKYPKKSVTIGKLDDITDLKEFEVVETAQHAKLISKSVSEVLKEKLKRRNVAAHPSSIVITQAQADDVVTDLVHNVIAKLV